MIRSQALLERARPAKPPKPRRDLEVIQVGTIPAARADELIHVVVAALDPAVHDAGRLAPQDRRGAVAGLPGERGPGDTVEPGKHPRVTANMEVWCEDGRRTGNRSSTGYDVRGAKTAHSTHHQVVVSSRHRGLEQRHCLRPDASMPSLRSQCPAGSDPARSPGVKFMFSRPFTSPAKRQRRLPPRIRSCLSVRWKGQVTGAFTALADHWLLSMA